MTRSDAIVRRQLLKAGLIVAGVPFCPEGLFGRRAVADEPPAGSNAAARDRSVRAKLEMRVTLRHPKGAPLKEVIAEIVKATREKNDAGIPVYLNPVGLRLEEKTADAPVTVDVDGVPLKLALPQVLGPLGLTACVFEGVLVISSADLIEDDFTKVQALARDSTPKTRDVLSKLERPVPMRYPTETPLGRVLKDIQKATAGPGDTGLPIHVSPEGLKEAEKTLDSPVTIELVEVPLRATLRLMLRQLGMDYYVEDGLLHITARSFEVP